MEQNHTWRFTIIAKGPLLLQQTFILNFLLPFGILLKRFSLRCSGSSIIAFSIKDEKYLIAWNIKHSKIIVFLSSSSKILYSKKFSISFNNFKPFCKFNFNLLSICNKGIKIFSYIINIVNLFPTSCFI